MHQECSGGSPYIYCTTFSDMQKFGSVYKMGVSNKQMKAFKDYSSIGVSKKTKTIFFKKKKKRLIK